jgi:ferredoxin
MTIEIKEENCIGCGVCQSLCPECFSVQNGIAKIIKTDIEKYKLKEVSESCPCQAILIEK